MGCQRDVKNAALTFEMYLHDHPSSRSAIAILGQLKTNDSRGEFNDILVPPNKSLLRCGSDSAPIHFNVDLSKWREVRPRSRHGNEIAAYVRSKMTNGHTMVIAYTFNDQSPQLSPKEASQIDSNQFVDVDSVPPSTQPTPTTAR
jgi:hypothetical protein